MTGSPPEDPRAARARTRIGATIRGKYRLDQVLGIGGMATVYAATHRNQKRFAVKILHPELAAQGDLKQRFVREGYLANSLDHPGAVAILDDDVAEDGAPFLVMELLQGASLDRLWEGKGHRAPLRAAIAIADQVLDVLAAAHAKGLVHRDIKPANLFVTKDGAVKVLDFGVARLFMRPDDDGGPQSTRAGFVVGTPAFMAPEQALGRIADVDGRTDVWSVGALLFGLLSGRTVHEAVSGPEMIVKAGSAVARSLGQVAPDVPAAIVAVVDRALAFERNDRWESATAMRTALRSAHSMLFGAQPSATDIVHALSRGSMRRVPTADALASTAVSDPDVSRHLDAPSEGTRLSPLTTAGPLSSQTSPRTDRARATRSVAMAFAAVAVAAVSFAYALRGRPKQALPANAPALDAAPAARAIVVTDLPIPSTHNPEAASTYRRALQAYRDGSLREAIDAMERVIALDPEMGAAYLRAAIWTGIALNGADQLERFGRALALRATLDARDQAIARAFAPYFSLPADLTRVRSNLAELAATHPGDAEILFYEAVERTDSFALTADESEWRDAIAADPDFGMIWNSIAAARLMVGDPTGAEAAATRCLRANASSGSCLRLRADAQLLSGRCADAAQDARAMVKFHPTIVVGREYLAIALSSQGEPDSVVLGVLENGASQESARGDEVTRMVLLPLARGRFAEADRNAARLLEGNPGPAATFGAELKLARMEILDEIGGGAMASEIAQALWRDRNVENHVRATRAWRLPLAQAGARLAREGRIDRGELERARQQWTRDMVNDGLAEVAWSLVYADGTETGDDAAVARSALSDVAVLLPGAADGAAALPLAKFAMAEGRPGDAKAPLEALTASCALLARPIEQTRGFELLGEVNEASGDRDAACGAYRTVLARWGNATPKSVTADKARGRMKALGCAP